MQASAPLLLCVDIGRRRVGLAGADARDGLALPLPPLVSTGRRSAQALPLAVAAQLRARRSVGLVAGVPFETDNKTALGRPVMGDQARFTLGFLRQVSEELSESEGEPGNGSVALLVVDETATTRAALAGAPSDKLRRRLTGQRDGRVDSLAAQVMLGPVAVEVHRHWLAGA